MVRSSPLDDPANARHAWARYKRMMRLMGVVTLVVLAIAMSYLYAVVEEASIHFYIASALGIAFTSMLTGALMGLVFLSHGTGHDDAVENSLDALDLEKREG
jgi:hypothetical protein